MNKVFLYLKGLGMGAADVVPGVSGGTIAFITGIYEELLNSIKSVDLEAFKLLFAFKWKAFWQKINGGFLLVLLAGIATSILTLSRLVLYLLEHYPILLWSFFFGLIIASVLLVGKQVKNWGIAAVVALAVGTAIAWYISGMEQLATESPGPLYALLCGSIAICAMILPGISGSFILILLGAYQFIFGALQNVVDGLLKGGEKPFMGDLQVVAAFIFGCVVGLLSFARLLSWTYKKYHDVMVAVLIGFLVGSLRKVWPWKETMSSYVDRHGVEKPLLQENITPFRFEDLTGSDAMLLMAVVLAVVGFFSVYGLEMFASKKGTSVEAV